MSRDWRIAFVAIASMALLFGVAQVFARASQPVVRHEIVAPPATEVPQPPATEEAEVSIPELPPAEPSSDVPTLVEAGSDKMDARLTALAAELAKMWTTNSEQLVQVIDKASRQADQSPSVTLLLAIAHAETNGKILDVSEAGAVGLAQATPIAYRQEDLQGRIFVTRDYLIGARAYIMKKPLGDADTIASYIVEKDDPKRRRRAGKLLDSAFALRLEGVDELELLAPFADQRYAQAIKTAKSHNLRRLKELRTLLDQGSKKEVKRYRDKVRKEYRDLKRTQIEAWRRYQFALIGRRDKMIEEHFGMPAALVKSTKAYEAGEFLAAELDHRFSPTDMAAFLVSHLERKAQEARRLSRGGEREIEEMTAALYNGGSHNVKRMLAGLIRSLPETEKYRKKVPATRRRLDHSLAALDQTVN